MLCREHGQQLKELAADTETNPLEGFELFGIIKETGVDDAGLTDFHDQYFPFPLYRDVDLKFYEAFGKRSIMEHVTFNPLRIFSGLWAIKKRLDEKNVKGNTVGEGIVTGGLIIFGADGAPKYIAPEATGSPLDEEALLTALDSVRKMNQSPSEL
eukprot:scaffold2353_cov134-Cylindrotheca_fusiformis.AAC.14